MAGDLTLADLGDSILSDDILATKDCVERIAAELEDPLSGENNCLLLSCKESGSTLRFIVPLAAALGIRCRIVGEGRLPLRPLGEYTRIFDGKGVALQFLEDGRFLPLQITGQLAPGVFEVPGNVSSQYISGLLMALPLLSGNSEIILTTPLESEPYVEMTRDVMRAYGVEIDKQGDGYFVRGGQAYYRSAPYRAEPDFSQAAFWLVAEYLGNKVSVLDLPDHTSQGDSEIRTLLKRFRKISGSSCEGEIPYLEVNASQIPDLVPILCVAAAATRCITRITHAQRLRMKESDRLKATCDALTKLGVEVEETEDGLIISGKQSTDARPLFRSCEVDSYHDHRIVMMAAIAATRADGPVCISDYRAVDKSYPDFFINFQKAGGIANELNVGK
jgi:3-phosphoshikimate 1-carboxyvinyltransferase